MISFKCGEVKVDRGLGCEEGKVGRGRGRGWGGVLEGDITQLPCSPVATEQ